MSTQRGRTNVGGGVFGSRFGPIFREERKETKEGLANGEAIFNLPLRESTVSQV